MKMARVAAGTVLGLVMAGASATGAVAAPARSLQVAPPGQTAGAVSVTTSAPRPMAAKCLVWIRTSKNYHGYTAGYSWAWNKIVGPGYTGNRVKEIQCLVQYWGHDPGPMDGIYGSRTTAAVKAMQRNCDITADGVVGPDTWRCMRDV